MKIQAAILRQRQQELSVETVNIDQPHGHEVLVKIVATGICHTDISVQNGTIPIPETPCILGHEGAGVIESIGAKVSQFKSGDRVAISYAVCGQCESCLRHEPFHCQEFVALNFSGSRRDSRCTHHQKNEDIVGCFFGQSSFATHALVDERSLVSIPDEMPLELSGPLGCGILTGAGAVLNCLQPEANSSIAVFGVGAVGLAAVMAAKASGCSTIIAVDIHNNRLDLAQELGATHVINSAVENLSDAINSIVPSGLKYSVEATGIPEIMASAIELLGSPGHAAIAGVGAVGNKLALDATALSGKTIRGVMVGDAVPQTTIPRLIELYLSGEFPFDRLVKFYPLDQINQAVEDAKLGVTIKPIIRMP